MPKDFEIILDECINRILMKGATVEDCLASYPDKATELEAHLRLVTKANLSISFTPSDAAKDRARLRIQAVMRELEQKERIVRSSATVTRRFSFSFRPMALLAVFLIIATIMASSIGTVAASGNSLPGELLYPVKRATEQARLALEFSQAGKAELHLSFAERRAEEVTELVERGDTLKLDIALENLNESIEEASRSASAVQDASALENLKTKLENSATRTVANLQTVVEKAPEAKRSQTDKKVQKVNTTYGQAVEKVALRTKDPHIVASPGILQFWATNPSSEMERVLIEVGRIEAYLVAGKESQWVTVVSEPQIFDLVRLAETQKFLGEQKVKPGTYTRIKFEIIKAVVVSGGKEIEVKVPSRSLTLVRPFIIEEGQTTRVFLDFTGEKFLLATGQGEFVLSPNVHALVNKPAQNGLRPEKEKPVKKESPAKKTAGPSEVVKPPVKIDIEGTIEEVATASFTIKGKSIIINSNTRMNRPLEKGEKARVEALVHANGTVVATRVEMEKKVREKPTIAPPVTISGPIESISLKEWKVSGQRIQIVPETVIKGKGDFGLIADVVGRLQPDGSLVARQISIKPKPTSNIESKRGQPATRPPQEPVKKPSTERLKGNIESISPIKWTIKGREILLSKDTKIEGTPAVGFQAEVEGILQPDNKILAIGIKITGSRPSPTPKVPGKPGKPADTGSKKDKTPVASPTPKTRDNKPGATSAPLTTASPGPAQKPPSKPAKD